MGYTVFYIMGSAPSSSKYFYPSQKLSIGITYTYQVAAVYPSIGESSEVSQTYTCCLTSVPTAPTVVVGYTKLPNYIAISVGSVLEVDGNVPFRYNVYGPHGDLLTTMSPYDILNPYTWYITGSYPFDTLTFSVKAENALGEGPASPTGSVECCLPNLQAPSQPRGNIVFINILYFTLSRT